MKRIAYFPGCSLTGLDSEYDHSSKLACRELGIDLVEVEDWNCCGATSAHSTDRELSVILPGRTLGIVEKMGLDTLTTPCAACYSRFIMAQEILKEKPEMASRLMPELGISSPDAIKVYSLLQVISDLDQNIIKEKIRVKLSGLKPACYYGCLLVRPSGLVGEKHPENPMAMDRLMSLFGAEPVTWYHKTECCGAALSLSRTDVVLELNTKLTTRARESGANCMVTSCPLCFTNLDLRQPQARKHSGITDPPMPVFYFTELLALGFGIPKNKLAFGKHIINTTPILKEIIGAGAVKGEN